jgi:hypothetical protein
MKKGNMAYGERKIRANTMSTQTIGTEHKKTLLHNFKMYTNVTTLKRGTMVQKTPHRQQSK